MDRLGPNSANSSPLTPLGFIERTAVVYGDRPAVVYNQTVYTWSETYRRSLRLASALVSVLRISPGDVVSVLAPNIPAMYEMHFGVPMSGAVLNTINTRLDPRTISILLLHSNSRILFVDILSISLAESSISLLPSTHTPPILIPIEDPYESPVNLTPFHQTYNKLLSLGDPNFTWIRPLTEWSPIILNYTSGTTSAPKGVVHCHRGVFIVSLDSLLNWSVPQHPIFLWTLPMFHANGWCFPWGMAAVAGTNVCLRRFDGPDVFAAIADHKVTHLCGAPVVLNMLANSPPAKRRQLPGIVKILTAGAPPPAAVLARVESLGFRVSHGYGLTETAGLVVSCAWKEEWDGLPEGERARLKARQGVRTVGMAAMDVVDGGTGRSVPWDGATMGEVVLRGGHVMLGYLKDEEATARAINRGWFFTGDVGVMHGDGYLEIRDRSKDVIISGGENISSVEVESIMYGHPAVDEAAVVARPDEYWGETPCAFVGLKKAGFDGNPPTEAEVIAWCRDRMPHFIVPKTVVFLSELPKTSTGKIQKYVLRNMAKKLGSLTPAPPANKPPASKL